MTTTATGEAHSPMQPVSVLLVEDDQGDAILVEDLITDASPEFRIVWAASAAAARKILATEKPDCVLLDLHLPDADGLGALRAIQECASDVPVVVLTGLVNKEFGATAVAAGAQDYLVKGRVDGDGLRRAVHYAIERMRAALTVAELKASQVRAEENARLERGLLPTPRIHRGVEAVARYRPGRASALLGGDFYDVLQTDDGLVHVVIGDVCGHGPDAAALGVALRIGWRALVIAGVPARDCLIHLDRLLQAERSDPYVFATLTVLTVDARTRTVDVIRAGHPPMLLHSASAIDWIETPCGRALGIPGPADREPHRIDLPADCGLVLLTDGLYEGHAGPGHARLGEDGLLRLAAPLAPLPGEEFLDGLIAAAEMIAQPHGGLADDVAVVRVQITQTNREPG